MGCEDSTTCLKCLAPTELDGKGGCIPCLDEFFYEKKSATCQACGKDCFECRYANTCLKCNAPTELDDDGSCVPCLAKTFFENRSGTCQACGDNCHQCAD